MFSSKGPTSAMWKSIALDLQGEMILAQVRNTQTKVVNLFNIENFPTLVVLPGGTTDGLVYSGEMKRDPLFKYLFGIVEPASSSAGSSASSAKESTAHKKQDNLGTLTRKLI
jgi:protein disulfide-isomerase A6